MQHIRITDENAINQLEKAFYEVESQSRVLVYLLANNDISIDKINPFWIKYIETVQNYKKAQNIFYETAIRPNIDKHSSLTDLNNKWTINFYTGEVTYG